VIKRVKPSWSHWIRSVRDEQAVRNGCTFDEDAASRVRDFFSELLQHSKGSWAGKSFELLDWQYEDVVAPIFGWKRPDGTRRFRRAYIEIPKKNGKSTLAAGLALYMLVADKEPGAHVFSAAATRDQASLVYGEAANMVQASPELQKVLTVRRSTKRILFDGNDASYVAISSDADTAQGLNAHCVIMDELHAWRNREFYESLMYAGRMRDQPLFFIITTAGDDVSGICYEQHKYAQSILDGDIEGSNWHVYIRSAGPEDNWKDPETWRKANPSLDKTINIETIREDCEEALDSPTKENAFRRYTLNQWVGSSASWLSMDNWQSPEMSEQFSEQNFVGMPAYGGIDLSTSRDLSAVVWFIPDDDKYYIIPRLYIPEGQIKQRERMDHVPYGSWIDQGFLRTTHGDTIEQAKIREDILRDTEFFDVRDIGYDPYNAQQLCEEQLEHLHGLPMTAVRQTMGTIGPASTEFESMVTERQLRHGGHPVLGWMASGCVEYRDTNDNVRPIKKRSTTRIDGIIATIIAISRWMVYRETRSVYSERGVLEV
jgi:phage terminase large subunit-like protein